MISQHHILFISSWYPNRNDATHGLFNKVFAQAAALHNKVSVLHVCSEEALEKEFELVESTDDGIYTCIVYYKKIKNKLPGVSQLLKRKRLIHAFELGYQQILNGAGKPELIQLNVAMPAGVGVMHLSNKYAIPYVINEGWSGYYPEDGNYKGFFLKYFTRKIISKARLIMPVSEGLKTAMLAHHLNGNYQVVPNVVNEELFKPLAHAPHSDTHFLHISSLNNTEKNVSGIIRAFGKAYQSTKNLRLHLVGDGEDINELRTLVNTLQLSEVIQFKGRVMGQELVNEINTNDALVMFSNYETFGITIIEALACGKPVITAHSGGVGNLVTPELGFVVNRKDENALAEKMLLLASQKDKFDPKVLRNFVTERFTVTRIGAQLAEIYQTVLKSR